MISWVVSFWRETGMQRKGTKKDGVTLGEIIMISWVVSGPLLSFP